MSEQIRWMSTRDAAEYLGVTLRSLYRFIDEGALTAYKFGRVIRLKEQDVEKFIEASRYLRGRRRRVRRVFPPLLHCKIRHCC